MFYCTYQELCFIININKYCARKNILVREECVITYNLHAYLPNKNDIISAGLIQTVHTNDEKKHEGFVKIIFY